MIDRGKKNGGGSSKREFRWEVGKSGIIIVVTAVR